MRSLKIPAIALILTVALVPFGNTAHAAALGTIVWDGNTLSQSTLSAQIGDTFVIESQEPTNTGLRLIGPVSASGTACTGVVACVVNPQSAAPNNVKTFTVTGFGVVAFDLTGNSVASLTLSSGGSQPSSALAVPAPVVQEFGKPATGTCDAAQPAGLDWAGVPSGGWANSWSQWMNGGSGGFVCTRTLVYSAPQAKWILG